MVLTYANISEKVAVCVFVVTYQTALVQCVYVIIQAVIQQRPCCQTCRVRCFYSPSNLNTVLFRRDVQLILTFKSWSDANFVPLFYNTVSRLVSHVFRWHACEYIGKQAILNAGHYVIMIWSTWRDHDADASALLYCKCPLRSHLIYRYLSWLRTSKPICWTCFWIRTSRNENFDFSLQHFICHTSWLTISLLSRSLGDLSIVTCTLTRTSSIHSTVLSA